MPTTEASLYGLREVFSERMTTDTRCEIADARVALVQWLPTPTQTSDSDCGTSAALLTDRQSPAARGKYAPGAGASVGTQPTRKGEGRVPRLVLGRDGLIHTTGRRDGRGGASGEEDDVASLVVAGLLGGSPVLGAGALWVLERGGLPEAHDLAGAGLAGPWRRPRRSTRRRSRRCRRRIA